LPDWLASEEGDEEPSLVHTGWLNAIAEPDMEGWLAAEDEATSVSQPTGMDIVGGDDADSQTDGLVETGGLLKTGGLVEESRRGDAGPLNLPPTAMHTGDLDEALVLAELELDDVGLGLDQEQLQAARGALTGGDIDEALAGYQALVEAGSGLHTIISDLEKAASVHQDKPMVRRMLGDAYVRNGQLNKAIDTYRAALDQM
jgi:hypothetical protein